MINMVNSQKWCFNRYDMELKLSCSSYILNQVALWTATVLQLNIQGHTKLAAELEVEFEIVRILTISTSTSSSAASLGEAESVRKT